MKETTTEFNEISIEERKEGCNMLEQLKIDQEFTQKKIDNMADDFIKYVIEISKWGTNLDENAISYLIQILLLKYFTNITLSDDLIDIITTLKPIEGEIGSIMKQFSEAELIKAINKIKSTSDDVEKKIQELMESEEYANLH